MVPESAGGAWPLTLRRLVLVTRDGEEEVPLDLTPGLNIVRGPRQAGKTTLLRFIDWVLGNAHTPIEHFGNELLAVYVSASLELDLQGERHVLTRSLDRDVAGPTTKVSVDGDEVTLNAVDDWILSTLGWPRIRIPKGKVHAVATEQVRLTFRNLLRHIYRREDSWQDFAYREDEFQRQASLSYLLGFAEQRYAPALFEEGVAQRALSAAQTRLRAAQENAEFILASLTKNLSLDETELGGLDKLRADVTARLRRARARRSAANAALLSPSVQRDHQDPDIDQWREGLDAGRRKISGLNEALASFESARELVKAEIDRLAASADAVARFGVMDVHQCPACDANVDLLRNREASAGVCYLCSQEVLPGSRAARLHSEIESLRGELSDIDDVFKATQEEIRHAMADVARLESELAGMVGAANRRREQVLAPRLKELTEAASAVSALEQQLSALKLAFQAMEIRDRRQAELASAQELAGRAQKEARAANVDRKEADRRCRVFAGCMTDFLHSLSVDPWEYGDVTLLSEELDFYVGDSPWRTKLGGETKVLFLFAYSYAIAALPEILPNVSRFPGFMLLDNPIQQGLPDDVVGEVLANFSSLAERLGEQVIACIVRDVSDGLPATASGELANARSIEVTVR